MKYLESSLLVTTLLFLATCGGGGGLPISEEEDVASASETVEEEPLGPPRVFFISPEDNEELAADLAVTFEFGSENFQISAIPINNESARENIGHYHLGVNTDCLPPGEFVPMADPWMHFGNGSNTIDMQLEPGQHTFTLQAGNDKHRTFEDLCETIEIKIVEGI